MERLYLKITYKDLRDGEIYDLEFKSMDAFYDWFVLTKKIVEVIDTESIYRN